MSFLRVIPNINNTKMNFNLRCKGIFAMWGQGDKYEEPHKEVTSK